MPVKGRQTITEMMAARKALKEAEAAKRAAEDAKHAAERHAQMLAHQRTDLIAHLGVAVALQHSGIDPRNVVVEYYTDGKDAPANVRYATADGAPIDIAALLRSMPYVVGDDADAARFVVRDGVAMANP